MPRKKTESETVKQMLAKVLSNQEEFNRILLGKRKSDNVHEDTQFPKEKMKTRETVDLSSDAADLNQASHLLEEQDLTDVFDKILEDALDDLLSEPRSGDFLPTEEIATALSEVDKQMGKTPYKDISYSDGAIQQQLQVLQVGDMNAITSTVTSNELNSVHQDLSTLTLEARPCSTNLGSFQSQGPVDSMHDAPHNQMQMDTSIQVGGLGPGNVLPEHSAGNFLVRSIQQETNVHTQAFPRQPMRQYYQGPRRNRWPFNHAKSRYHCMAGPSHTRVMPNLQWYTQQLGATNMAQGNTTTRTTAQRIKASNAISCLNDICPGLQYQLVSRTGPVHAPFFTIQVIINGVTYIGTGPNQKCAKHAAAEAALKTFAFEK